MTSQSCIYLYLTCFISRENTAIPVLSGRRDTAQLVAIAGGGGGGGGGFNLSMTRAAVSCLDGPVNLGS